VDCPCQIFSPGVSSWVAYCSLLGLISDQKLVLNKKLRRKYRRPRFWLPFNIQAVRKYPATISVTGSWDQTNSKCWNFLPNLNRLGATTRTNPPIIVLCVIFCRTTVPEWVSFCCTAWMAASLNWPGPSVKFVRSFTSSEGYELSFWIEFRGFESPLGEVCYFFVCFVFVF